MHGRREKKTGGRIPEHLRSEAIALVEVDGLALVTRRLRLSGRHLNRRRGIVGNGQPQTQRAEQPDAFVALASEVIAEARARGADALPADTIARIDPEASRKT